MINIPVTGFVTNCYITRKSSAEVCRKHFLPVFVFSHSHKVMGMSTPAHGFVSLWIKSFFFLLSP